MRRKLFTLAAAVSAVLCVLSYSVVEAVSWVTDYSWSVLATERGRLHISHATTTSPVRPPERGLMRWDGSRGPEGEGPWTGGGEYIKDAWSHFGFHYPTFQGDEALEFDDGGRFRRRQAFGESSSSFLDRLPGFHQV